MNIFLLFANLLTAGAFFLHTFGGDKEILLLQPLKEDPQRSYKQGLWTMSRCGWHWISFDLLFISILLGLINHTSYFDEKDTLLNILTIYCFGYGLSWLVTIAISKQWSRNYLKLGQWMLLWTIGILIYLGH
ncbi:MAG: hypothetical protein JXQ90_18695 [Cyclobacteriaceae bacterium]